MQKLFNFCHIFKTLWFGNRLLFSSKASSKTQALSLFTVCNKIISKGYFINWPLRTSVLSPTSERWESSGRLRLLTKASVKVGKTGLRRDLVTPRFNSPMVQIMVACKDKIVIMITNIRSLNKGEQSFWNKEEHQNNCRLKLILLAAWNSYSIQRKLVLKPLSLDLPLTIN